MMEKKLPPTFMWWHFTLVTVPCLLEVRWEMRFLLTLVAFMAVGLDISRKSFRQGLDSLDDFWIPRIKNQYEKGFADGVSALREALKKKFDLNANPKPKPQPTN